MLYKFVQILYTFCTSFIQLCTKVVQMLYKFVQLCTTFLQSCINLIQNLKKKERTNKHVLHARDVLGRQGPIGSLDIPP